MSSATGGHVLTHALKAVSEEFGAFETMGESYVQTQILLISEAGFEAGTEYRRSTAKKNLFHLVNERWGRASTVVVSQRPFATWHEAIGEPTLADAICDRLFAQAEKVELKGESLRRKAMDP